MSARSQLCAPGLGLLVAALLDAGTAAASEPLELAREQFEADRYGEARRILEPTVDAASPARERLWMARICNRQTDWECSLGHAEAAVAGLPDDSAAQFEYALALRIKMSEVSKMKAMFSLGDYKEALARAIELDSNNVDAREEEIGFLIHSPGFAGRDLDMARVRIAELEKIDWPRGATLRAELERETDNDPEAERIYQRVIDRAPDHAQTRISYGFFLVEAERWRDAVEQFAAVSDDAEPVHRFGALYQLGRVRVLGGFEAEQAVEIFDRYVDTVDEALAVPSRSNAYWRQGMAYEQLGRTEAARDAYRRAVRLDADNKNAKQALRKLGG